MISIIAVVDNTNTAEKVIDIDDSITSVINQTYKDWELKIVLYNITIITEDDNSIIQKYKNTDPRIDVITYYNDQANTLSLSKILTTTAHQHCKYNYIALLYLGDIWLPNKLELQVNTISKYHRIEILGSKSSFQGEVSCNPEGELYHYNILKVNPFVNSTVVMKKNILHLLHLLDLFENRNEFIGFDIILNALWVHAAIQQSVLYNISDITVIHVDNKTFLHYTNCYETNEFKKVLDDFRAKYIRVKFFSDYCVSGHSKQEYEKACAVQNIEYYGKTKKIYFTVTETYTHAILLNCPTPPNLQVPPTNVVGFAQEPHDTPFLKIYQNNFIEYAVKHIGKYFIGSVHTFPTPTFVGHHGFLFYETPKQIPFSPQKRKLMSIMVSRKTYTLGHQYRHIIAGHILKNNLPIDIWGNGVENYKRKFPNNKNIMGGFKSMEEMCRNYLFTIAIENTSHDHYFTEKLINPFINNTIPLYWGCKKVEEYFPKHAIRLTGNIGKDMNIIHTVLKNPNKYISEYKIDQEMVLNKVNLVKNIERIFDC
jgi:hypothetical protein